MKDRAKSLIDVILMSKTLETKVTSKKNSADGADDSAVATHAQEQVQLMLNDLGVLLDTNCTYCEEIATYHYSQQEKKDTNKCLFLQDNQQEICGKEMCDQCIFAWPGQPDACRAACIACKVAKDKKAAKYKKEKAENMIVTGIGRAAHCLVCD